MNKLLFILLIFIACNNTIINPELTVTAIKKEFAFMPRYGVSGIKTDNVETYAVGNLIVFVYNELGSLIRRFNGVNYIIQKNDKYYISNKNKILGIYSINHTIDYYCIGDN